MIFVNKTRLNTRRTLAAAVLALLLSASSGLVLGYLSADDSAELARLKARIAALEEVDSDIAVFTVSNREPFSYRGWNSAEASLEFEDKGYLGVTGDLERDPQVKGVPLDTIRSETAAEVAGLQSGDVILAIDGLKTESFEELRLEIQSRQPGDPALFLIARDGVTFEYLIKLGSWNSAHD